jgi:glucose-1-phosphate cytidylyltransferase
MKVVLFCEGLGDCIREYSETIPKPCLGYKANVIKDHFLSYRMTASTDCIVSDFA